MLIFAVILGTGWVGLSDVEREMKKNLANQLSDSLATNVQSFKMWAQNKKHDSQVLAAQPSIREKILSILEKSKQDDLPLTWFQRSQDINWLREHLKAACQKYNFAGFILLDPTGLQVGSLMVGDSRGRKLAGLSDFFYRSMQGDTVISLPFASQTALADEKGMEWKHMPIMMASTPIFDDSGEVAGVIAFQLRPEEEFTKVLNISQTGETGETFAFDSEARMLSLSKFVKDLPRIGLIPNGPKSLAILNLQMRDPGGNLMRGHRPSLDLSKRPLTYSASRAINGRPGINVEGYNDYRGVKVVGAWTWLEQYHMGISTKMDTAEALRPLTTMRRTFALQFYLLVSTVLLGMSLRMRQKAVEDQKIQAEKLLRSGEVRMQAIMDNVNEGILTVDEQGNVESFNKGAEIMFGISADEIIGQKVDKLIPESYCQEYSSSIQIYQQTKKSGIFGSSLEIKGLRKDNTTFPVELTVKDMEINGRPMFTGILRDITERKKGEEALVKAYGDLQVRSDDLSEANDKLSRSNQELDDFAYIASHDLKEPLRGIHNYSTFLIEDYSDKIDEEGKSKLNTLVRLTQRMETLINSLLYFSRVGRVDLAIQETDLNEGIHGVLDSLHVTLEEKNIDVRIPRLLPNIVCDQTRVIEVFRNLITNAMKYNDKEEKWIEIGFLQDEETKMAPLVPGGMGSTEKYLVGDINGHFLGRPKLIFYVRDNGIGIREKHLDSVFRIFKRLHGRDKFGGGTGAGLTIVKKIVERHEGHIWVDSTFGEGTTFYFTLQGEKENGFEQFHIEQEKMHPVG